MIEDFLIDWLFALQHCPELASSEAVEVTDRGVLITDPELFARDAAAEYERRT